MFGWIKNALGGGTRAADPYEQFVREFVEACRQQNMLPKTYDPQARAFLFGSGDGEMKFHLENVFREWLAGDQRRREDVVSRFVQSVSESLNRRALVPEELPKQLMPGIRSRAQIGNVMIHNWIVGAPPDDAHATEFLPFLGDMVACAMRELPHSMSQMTRANLAYAELSIERAMEHALANFRSKLPVPTF
jgi:hypothetical protein